MPAKIAPAGRLVSLDVFRGATIASMLLVNNSGDWDHTYAPLLHAKWHGWTFTDLVFPSFLWIMGVAMTLSFARRVEQGASRTVLMGHVAKRAAIIFVLGLLLNGFPRYDLATLRIPGVLQRIAVCYLIAAAIFLYSGLRTQMVWVVGLLAGYWVLMKAVPVPGYGAGVLEPVGNLAWYIDSLVLKGHMWAHTGGAWDPEGLLSTIPSIATVLFGVLCGHLLRTPRSHAERAVWMFVSGNALLVAGLVLSTWMPINKMIWTTSYAVFAAGMAFNGFAICYWVVEGTERKRWAKPLVVFGMNAIAAYVLSDAFDQVLNLSGLGAWLKTHVFAPLANPYNAALLYAVLNVLLVFAVVAAMYRRKWFLRI